MQASQDGDAELVKILCETPGVNINHQSKVSAVQIYVYMVAISIPFSPAVFLECLDHCLS